MSAGCCAVRFVDFDSPLVPSWKAIIDHLLTHEKTMFKDLMSKSRAARAEGELDGQGCPAGAPAVTIGTREALESPAPRSVSPAAAQPRTPEAL